MFGMSNMSVIKLLWKAPMENTSTDALNVIMRQFTEMLPLYSKIRQKDPLYGVWNSWIFQEEENGPWREIMVIIWQHVTIVSLVLKILTQFLFKPGTLHILVLIGFLLHVLDLIIPLNLILFCFYPTFVLKVLKLGSEG